MLTSSLDFELPVTSSRDLVAFFQSCEKPKKDWRIASAHEKFPYHLATLLPVGYDEAQGLKALLTGLQDFGWHPVLERGHVVALSRAYARIGLEPGGQIRFTGAPMGTLHELAAEIDQHLQEMEEISAPLGLGYLGMGFHPLASDEEISWVSTAAARILLAQERMQIPVNLDVTRRCCAAHVSLNYANETDMVSKFRVALALEPVVNALFASSPFVEGAPCGVNSQRAALRAQATAERFGAPVCAFEDGFGYERYVDYVLDIPVGWIVRDGRELACGAQTFRDFLEGKLSVLPGQTPKLGDWVAHVSRIFPDTRLTGTLDLCGADSGDSEMLLALPSLWTGILYDDSARDAAWELVCGWTAQDMAQLRDDVIRFGLRATVKDQPLSEFAEILLKHAQNGLRRRTYRLHEGADEARYLGILFSMVDIMQNRSDQLLMYYEHYKDFNIRSVFDICRLKPPPLEEREQE